ncbi:MAG: UDP-N-acetylmuramate dehydrogenase [Chloroflexi bacterium]|nr:UDP-N-acetylmuramate dehydrogenase [Chloroflexota bacterium]
MDNSTLTSLIGAPVKAGERLARHCSWRVGGPAEYFVAAKTVEVLKRAVQVARAVALPYRVIGRGTNILFADAGVRGLLIVTACDHHRLTVQSDAVTLYADAGASLPLLANTLAKQGWAGLEWAVGIPSAMGSAIVNNAGAHGSCIADVIQQARIIDGEGREITLTASEMQFAYRQSRFKGSREVILSAEFLLKRDSLEAVGERLRRFNDYRRATQPSDPSAGSVFKNPPGYYAGALIEAAGLKGAQVGGAMVSPVHANFFVNTGAASAHDLLRLIRLAQERVAERSGVRLEPEIEFVGEWGELIPAPAERPFDHAA